MNIAQNKMFSVLLFFFFKFQSGMSTFYKVLAIKTFIFFYVKENQVVIFITITKTKFKIND